MASVIRNFATGWSLGLQPFSPSQQEEVDLDRHIALILARTGRFSTGWAVIMLLLWWPTDLLVFHRLPAALPAFAALRAALLAASLLVVVGLWRRESVSPRAQLLFFTPWPLACLAMSYSLGTLGGLDTPWFHFTYLCVALTIFFPVRPLRRAAYAILVAVSLILGHLAADPGMLRSPFLPATLGFLVFIVVGSVAFGQLLFLLTRSHFFQAQALRRAMSEDPAQRFGDCLALHDALCAAFAAEADWERAVDAQALLAEHAGLQRVLQVQDAARLPLQEQRQRRQRQRLGAQQVRIGRKARRRQRPEDDRLVAAHDVADHGVRQLGVTIQRLRRRVQERPALRRQLGRELQRAVLQQHKGRPLRARALGDKVHQAQQEAIQRDLARQRRHLGS